MHSASKMGSRRVLVFGALQRAVRCSNAAFVSCPSACKMTSNSNRMISTLIKPTMVKPTLSNSFRLTATRGYKNKPATKPMKTKSATKKRFRVTGKGKLKFKHCGKVIRYFCWLFLFNAMVMKAHLLGGKSTVLTRRLGKKVLSVLFSFYTC